MKFFSLKEYNCITTKVRRLLKELSLKAHVFKNICCAAVSTSLLTSLYYFTHELFEFEAQSTNTLERSVKMLNTSERVCNGPLIMAMY